ncbi:hemolysin family protein [Pedobacter frigoris]|uniref:HlyC/CorC family transporter n=1 Tax=Pedobacter frigoris TaxID=2571272 RepID=A0A4U1CJ31_9SPHI|nr:hemolysin family protein [Pedobacter frigoris]TKC07447.1 HlyC/CorC family transporter [Pedobacter frigoris]
MELLIIFILTLLNGFFALSEIALVSVKKSRIEHLAAQGSANAKTVLKLLDNPENFLSSVQVGITLIGVISGAYGGAALTDDMVGLLSGLTFLGDSLHTVSLIIVIGSITYFTIVVGELVPKTIAMNNSERISLFCVPVIRIFTLITYPFVKLLSISTSLILKLLGIKENEAEKVSEDELRFMLKTAGKQGVLENEESEAFQNLFSFTDQTAKSLMTHSSEVEWINYNWSKEIIFNKVKESVHSRFIVADGILDKPMGVINIKDLLENYSQDDFHLDQILTKPIYVIMNAPAFKILNLFKDKKQYMGVVVDEFGSVRGVITLHDLIEAIVGDLPDEDEMDKNHIIRREDDSYLLNGRTSIFELNQFFAKEIIENNISHYSTVSGFMMDHLKAMPHEGDIVKYENFKFEIVDMDGVRIDQVLMTKI